MKIDISRRPPADIYRGRSTMLRVCLALLLLAACGTILMIYGFVADTPPSAFQENTAVVLIVAPGLAFFYFAEKLKAYKGLSPKERGKLAELARQHAEIAAYCAQVHEAGREPVLAEYEACKDWSEGLVRKEP